MKEQDVTKLEFLLMCNDNIVVQRFFNVKGFNKHAHKSEEFYDYIRTFCNELKYDLKMRFHDQVRRRLMKEWMK